MFDSTNVSEESPQESILFDINVPNRVNKPCKLKLPTVTEAISQILKTSVKEESLADKESEMLQTVDQQKENSLSVTDSWVTF